VIAAELAKPQLWAQLEPAWKALVPAPKPARAHYVAPRAPHWIALECEALRRFDASGPPFSRTDFAKSLQNWCRTKFSYAPKDHVEIRRRVRIWLEEWRTVRAAERTARLRPPDQGQHEAGAY
jgi:hypothetical protein